MIRKMIHDMARNKRSAVPLFRMHPEGRHDRHRMRRSMSEPSPSFDEYWALFVRAHASPFVRRVHFFSVTAALGCAVLGVLTRRRGLVLAASAVAVVPPWAARKLDKGETLPPPLHPLLTLLATTKMWQMTLAGTMDAEVARLMGPVTEDEPADGTHPRPNMVTDHTLH
jgi:hypothetical protein